MSRAIDLLYLLAEHEAGMSITELARELSTQRPPLYRIVGSLMERGLVHRTSTGKYVLGAGLIELARPLERTLDELVAGPLQRAANASGAGAVLVLDTADGLVAAVSKSPETVQMHLVTPVGHRFSEGPIAPRLAIDSVNHPERAELAEIRDRGYATSSGQAFAGSWAAAFSVTLPDQYGVACVMLATMHPEDEDRLITVGNAAVAEIAKFCGRA
ncbi:DNA-binding IclR family transcriptional regulator [Leucobacter exalbidus]|uniref:DNA-binding IclR family transcriptional regulator n=1 Tax=Leucobacter exalbidus TaxID=662960 RepID=A0A940PPS8_9MICO|nr:DNA-binding IclR family transcriptional regulator [Leucobacter exalbidus]